MLRLIGCALAVGLMSAPGLPSAMSPDDDDVVIDGDCEVIRYLPNGKRVVTPASRRGSRGSGGVAASSVAVSGSGGSSVSVSSSSHSHGGRGSAVASSTRNGRTMTTTHTDDGCTVVIDDRRGRKGRR